MNYSIARLITNLLVKMISSSLPRYYGDAVSNRANNCQQLSYLLRAICYLHFIDQEPQSCCSRTSTNVVEKLVDCDCAWNRLRWTSSLQHGHIRWPRCLCHQKIQVGAHHRQPEIVGFYAQQKQWPSKCRASDCDPRIIQRVFGSESISKKPSQNICGNACSNSCDRKHEGNLINRVWVLLQEECRQVISLRKHDHEP